MDFVMNHYLEYKFVEIWMYGSADRWKLVSNKTMVSDY